MASIDQQIDDFISPATHWVESVVFFAVDINGVGLPIVLVWLLVAAIVFTFYMRFINLRGMKQAFKILRGDYHNPKDEGEVTHFQALATAISGTVGLGNIAGVAVAIGLGGPGATFWMILAGFLGMSSKFVECTLGVKYRRINADGTVSGGPMYYLTQGLAKRNMANLGKVLAVFFAVMCIGGSYGGGNMFQVNQAYAQFESVIMSWGFEGEIGWLFGIVVAAFVGLVIIGGIKSIGKVTRILVPFMCLIYVAAGLFIILLNIGEIPDAIVLIVNSAFSNEAIGGGFVGVLIQGIRRAAFSNEAGVGSAAIAHSAVKTNEPITEGLVALIEPFVDTIIVCTITALVVILTGAHLQAGLEGIEMTSMAFNSVIPGFDAILAIAVLLFAFSTMITWSYYGLKSWTFLFGESKAMDITYKISFLAFVVLGSGATMNAVIGFSDAMIFAMSFANIAGLYIMMPEVKRDLDSYLRRIDSGEIQPTRRVASSTAE
ncbi:MAG: alanine:cation symporter family protein [Alphaproteobacteria bacterium]|nr:MAG: alanine:cation symporter family protein [Alphaproteobacteria bacterium]